MTKVLTDRSNIYRDGAGIGVYSQSRVRITCRVIQVRRTIAGHCRMKTVKVYWIRTSLGVIRHHKRTGEVPSPVSSYSRYPIYQDRCLIEQGGNLAVSSEPRTRNGNSLTDWGQR